MNGVKCGTDRVVKNSHIHSNKQRLKCKECGLQGVENPGKRVLYKDLRHTIDN